MAGWGSAVGVWEVVVGHRRRWGSFLLAGALMAGVLGPAPAVAEDFGGTPPPPDLTFLPPDERVVGSASEILEPFVDAPLADPPPLTFVHDEELPFELPGGVLTTPDTVTRVAKDGSVVASW